ncbi:MAG: TIGR03915 family putative DNA repair protein [Edaphocola sp.]
MDYIFDGSYHGFLCCIFACFEYKDDVDNLRVDRYDSVQASFFSSERTILTDAEKAGRVKNGLEKAIGTGATRDFYVAVLSEDPQAWKAAFSIAVSIFSGQENVLLNYGDDRVLYFAQTVKKVGRERHRMKAFVRFSKSSDGLYFALVEPDFNVLPLIANFFRNRYADQRWLIYDVKRKYGLSYNLNFVTEVTLSPIEKEALSQDATLTLDEDDERYQTLWKRYYASTNIAARKNLKLHVQYVPKRYWKYLVEKQN